jgi:formamidopyrimidine-DNA glycosylase
MPELPEVETTRRGIEPFIVDRSIAEIIVRRTDLRQPIPASIATLEDRTVLRVTRRSKYLLLAIDDGTTLLIHLGMSGSLRVIEPQDPWKKHDHFALTLAHGKQLRFHDPRRFGLVLHLLEADPLTHVLLKSLGPEPLEKSFTPAHLVAACGKRSAAIKQVIMDAKVVVGVGNIYASEALFRAGILPQMSASKISAARLNRLVQAIQEVLAASIEEGGTTLRDFLKSDGEPGYFKQRLFVYDRKNAACRVCETPIQQAVLGQRATYWCPQCQK